MDSKREMKTLKDCYDYVVNMIKDYVDIDEKYVPVLGCWIIGTYFHGVFESYPYVFLNATKAGGKTRTLKLCSFLSKNGSVDVNLTEAVLFRMAAAKTSFFIDELESVSSKEKANLRLLLNAAYKKGMGVPRARKIPQTEQYVVDRFEVFTPIMMANIWGLDNVLQDRCITIILEKSASRGIINKLELWRFDKCATSFRNVMDDYIKGLFLLINKEETDVTDVYVSPAILYIVFPVFWNILMNSVLLLSRNRNNNVSMSVMSDKSVTSITYDDIIKNADWLDMEETPAGLTKDLCELGRRVWESGISGRDLELFMPLIMIAHELGGGVLDAVLLSAKEITTERKEQDVSENRDVQFIQYLMSMERDDGWISVRDITKGFKEAEGIDKMTTRWVGRALRRLGVRAGQRSTGKERQVIISWAKVERKARVLGIEIEQEAKGKEKEPEPPELGVPAYLKERGSK